MIRKHTRVISFMLAMILIISLCSISISSVVDYSLLKMVNGTVQLDGTSDGTVTVHWQGTGDQSIIGIEGTWSTTENEETGYLTLSSITSDAISFNPNEDICDAESGFVSWVNTNPANVKDGTNLLSATYTVDANTPAGTYTVQYVSSLLADTTSQIFDEVTLTATITVTYPPVSVNSISLNKNTLSLNSGEAETLVATVLPENATDKSVEWASDNEDVATVDSNGKVTAVAKGTANITVTTKDGNKVAICVVTVTCAHANKTNFPAHTAENCQDKDIASYFKCDACGQLFNYFEQEIKDIPYGNAGEHKWGEPYAKDPDDGKHYRTCTVEGCGVENPGEIHSGGTANCADKKICGVCNNPYGEVDATTHKSIVLVPAKTTADNCQDYTYDAHYKCESCGKLFSDNAGKTEIKVEPNKVAGAHSYVYTKISDTQHSITCSVEGCTLSETENHESNGVNVATCQAKAVCDDCKDAYGQFDSSNHTNIVDVSANVAADCREFSYDAHKKCDCEQIFDADGNEVEEIPGYVQGEHVWDATYDATNATSEKHYHICIYHIDVKDEGEAHTYVNDVCTICQFDNTCKHTNVEFVEAVQESCQGNGSNGMKEHYICKDKCGELLILSGTTYSVVTEDDLVIIPKHKLEEVVESTATCCKDGNLYHWHCTVCERNFASNDTAVPGTPMDTVTDFATGAHTDDDKAWEQSATKHWHTCTVGGTKFDEADHIPGEDFICDTCGYILKIAENGTYTKIEKTELTKVPATLAEKYETVEALEAELTRILVTNSTFTENNVQTFDVKLQYRNSATDEWIDATEANFPVEGITVELPYPEGTNGDTHDFKVTHMFTVTSAKLGTTAGNTETLEGKQIVETKDGIRVTLKGLSPVAVAWKATPKNDDSDDYRFWYYTVYQLMSQKFNVVATAGEGGTITDMGMSTVNYDMSKTYVITPDEGYEIDTVYVNGKDIGAVDQYTFRSIKRNQTISVTFRKLVWDNPFTDIAETDSYYNAIEFVYENGLFKGTSQTAFSPDTTMTRAMFVTVLGRLAGVEEKLYTDVSFNDVVAGEYYAPYVEWANDNGIVQGYGDGTFGINDEITVEQAAVIIARYVAFVGVNTASNFDLSIYADVADVSDWAYGAMQWAVENGIYVPETALVPKNDASRALVATMFYNFVTEYID